MNPEDIDISNEMDILKNRMSEKGLKSTPQRDELARWIFKVHHHFTVDDVVNSFRNAGKKVSVATVYRLLQMLLDLKMLQEHDFGKGQKYYEHTHGHPHHDHIICNTCGTIHEFTNHKLESLKEAIAKSHGFEMTYHSLHIFGICSNCKKENTTQK